MANTTNLDLVKPLGTDHALVAQINSNSDKIDAEAGRTRANFAAEYSASSAYAVGAFCTHNGIMYQCNTAIGSGGEAWTSGHWTQISAGDAIVANNQAIATLVKKTRTVTTTDSDGDVQALNDITQKAILGVIPVRNAGDGTYSSWFGVIIGAHSGTGLSVKCINDNNEKLASTKVAMDVYYIEQTFS